MTDRKYSKLKAAELDALGTPLSQIATMLGLDYNTISSWRNKNKEYIDIRNSYAEKAKQNIQESLSVGSLKAYTYLVNMLDDDKIPAELKVRIAESILDRTNIAKKEPSEKPSGNDQISLEILKVLQQAAIK